jgi:hypothetical protein
MRKESVVLSGGYPMADQYHYVPGILSAFFILKNVASGYIIFYEHGKK